MIEFWKSQPTIDKIKQRLQYLPSFLAIVSSVAIGFVFALEGSRPWILTLLASAILAIWLRSRQCGSYFFLILGAIGGAVILTTSLFTLSGIAAYVGAKILTVAGVWGGFAARLPKRLNDECNDPH